MQPRADSEGAGARTGSGHRPSDKGARTHRVPIGSNGSDKQSAVPETEPADPGIDPELEADLGAELEFRGDTLEAELGAARAEAAEAQAEAAELRDVAQRARAEFENYRKRMQREQAGAIARAGERIVAELLPAVDNLERAIDHTTAGGDLTQLLSGVEAVQQQVLGVLSREGVSVIDPFGQPFDPYKHEAVGQREDPEVAEGTVVEVYQKGYEMHGRVIRHAMVVVATGGPQPKE